MTCPSCGQEPPGEFPFCPFCGAAMTPAVREPGREERKVVSVLFADLVGFTARAEQLDPEDVRELLAPYHDHLRRELERFGGTVEKFIGDAVMAVFGAPVAHEDDAERAVRAALAIRDWAAEQGKRLQVRVAVTTGEALVSLDAHAAEGEALVAGDVVNTAARLQAAAPLNGVLVGDPTYRATRDVVDYEPTDPVQAKGKREPVIAWQALSAKSRLGVDVAQRPLAPMVGRARELDLLVAMLGRVREEREPQLVTVVGVPGIGKSRLAAELFHLAEADAELLRWRQGRSLPYGDGVTFWALAEIVKAEAGVLETDTVDMSVVKLTAVAERVAADPSEAQWLLRHLRPLVGQVDDMTPAGVDEAFAAWRRLLEALADERPTVVVFEDLHWADDTLLDFVDGLVDRTRGVPLLVLATARPELLQRRPAWGGGKPNAVTVSLSPLTDDEAGRLFAELLNRSVLPAETQTQLLERAGGNPLYAEQYARMLAERGALDELPETVHGIIAARLDALSEPEKRLLQDAAVIGKVFWAGAVGAVDGIDRRPAEDLLHALERKEFVQRARSSSVAGETEYAFRHVLIRDVAYAQIPRAGRADKHRRSAEWIEALGRPEEQAELLAHHYLEALELSAAAGRESPGLGDNARLALRDAGDRAAALFAADAAIRFYDAALRLWPSDDAGRGRLLLRRANPLRTMGSGDGDLLREAAEVALAAGDRQTAAEAEAMLSQVTWHRGDRAAWLAHGERAEQLLADLPPSRALGWLQARRAMTAFLEGNSGTAIELASRTLELAEREGWDEVAALALEPRGSARFLTDPEGGLADLRRAVELATRSGSLQALSRVHNSLSVILAESGDVRGFAVARQRAADMAEQIGSESDRRWFRGTATEPLFRAGDWEAALRGCEALLAEVDAGSPHYLTGQAAVIRGQILLSRGDIAGAVADAERALEHGRRIQQPQVLHYLVPQCAYVLAVAGETGRADALAREHLEVLAGPAELQFAIVALPVFAAACRRLGLPTQLLSALVDRPANPWLDSVRAYAGDDLATAADHLGRIGSLADEAEARVRAAEQCLAAGDTPGADSQLDRAVAFYRRVGATAYLRECAKLRPEATRDATA